MDTNFYDVVVYGGDLTGLLAAALISKRGTRVLVCGHDDPGPTFCAAGYTLETDPALLPSADAESVTRIFKELNLVQVIRRHSVPLSPAFQLALPNHRLDIGPDPATTAREIAREFPVEHDAMTGILERTAAISATLDPVLGSDLTLPPDGFWERREVARVEGMLPSAGTDVWAPLGHDHPLRAAATACALLGANLPPGELTATSQARAWNQASKGLQLFNTGQAGLRTALLGKISAGTGDVRARAQATDIVHKRGRATALRLGPRNETVGLEHLIWAGPTGALAELAGKNASRKLLELVSAMRPAVFRYTLALIIKREALPVGMGSRVFSLLDPARPPLGDNAIVITVGATKPRDEHVPLWVEGLVPAATVASGLGTLAVLRARMREHLGRVVPFFEQHLVVLASPHDGMVAELGPAGIASAPLAPLAAIPMKAAQSTDLPRALGVSAAPHDTGSKNILLAGDENLPGLGTEGAFVSAWGVVRILLGDDPKRSRSRKEILIEDG